MCEPSHSIVQYPDRDDNDNPTGTVVDAIPAPENTPGDFWHKLKKKIGSWFHFSFLGFGHSEAIGRLSPTAYRYLPMNTKYEATWWNRTVHRDGLYGGQAWDADAALESATNYAWRVSIGNLTLLRQFLETSIRNSQRPMQYFDQFIDMLTVAGRDLFVNRCKRVLGISMFNRTVIKDLNPLINLMMGFTRKRGLLVPAWADDTSLWVP